MLHSVCTMQCFCFEFFTPVSFLLPANPMPRDTPPPKKKVCPFPVCKKKEADGRRLYDEWPPKDGEGHCHFTN